MKRHKQLLYIDEQFTEIMVNRRGNHSRRLKSIERVLKSRYGLNVHMDIVENRNQMFFGMSVYPVDSVLDKVIEQLVKPEPKVKAIEDIWSKNNEWVIEIDSMLLSDATLGLNPQEMTSLLLHEIGHTVYANTIPQRLFKVFRYSLMSLSLETKKMLGWKGSLNLFKLPIIQACNQKVYRLYSRYEEFEADNFSVKEGYGDEIISAMNKIILRFTGTDLTYNEKDYEKDLRSIFSWSIDAIQQLSLRRDKVERMLDKQAQQTSSLYTLKIIDSVNKYFLGKYNELAENIPEKFKKTFQREKNLQSYNSHNERPMIVQEGFKDWFTSNKKVKPIHGSDVDVINIEIDKIDSETDRIFVLDMVYHRLDNVRYQMELLKDEKNAKRVQTPATQLRNYEKTLLEMRKKILSIKIPPKQYGVIVRYPKTYEG